MSIPAIDITDLTKTYGKARGISHISLKVEQGEIFGFIGPNGAGKSTTIRILLNLIFPGGGSARIMGMDVIRDTKKIKQRTGYIPSDAVEYPFMTVRGFLDYCGRFYSGNNCSKRINELIDLFELDPERKIADLSRGNKKKVSIVQSFIHSPDLLILDEPTMGLDPLMQEKFFELLRSENRRGMAIFFSSHILSEVQMLCKRVAIIREGTIVKEEDIKTLRSKQLKKVHVEMEEEIPDMITTIPGIESTITRTANKISFMFSGDINMLVGVLNRRTILNLTVEEPPLEEIFMHYYKQT